MQTAVSTPGSAEKGALVVSAPVHLDAPSPGAHSDDEDILLVSSHRQVQACPARRGASSSQPTTLLSLPDTVLGEIYSHLDKPSRINLFHTCAMIHSSEAILGIQMRTLCVRLTCKVHTDESPAPPSVSTQLATLPKKVQPRSIIFKSKQIPYPFGMNYALVLPQLQQACMDEQALARLGSVTALSFKGPCMLSSDHAPQLATLLRAACPQLSSLSIPSGVSFELVHLLHASGAQLEQLRLELTDTSAPKFQTLSQLETLRSLSLVTYNLSGLEVLRTTNLTRLSITGLLWGRLPDGLQAVLDNLHLTELHIPSLPSKQSGQRLRSRTLRTLVLQYVDTAPAFERFYEGLPRLKAVKVEDGFFLDPECADLDELAAWNRLMACSGDEAAGVPHIDCTSLTLEPRMKGCLENYMPMQQVAVLPHHPIPWVTGLRLKHIVIVKGHIGTGLSTTTNTYPDGLLPCSHLFPNVHKLELVRCPLECSCQGSSTLEQAVAAFPCMRELRVAPFTWAHCKAPVLFRSMLWACGKFQRRQPGHHLMVCVEGQVMSEYEVADAEAAMREWEAELAGLQDQPRRVSIVLTKKGKSAHRETG